MYDRVTFVNVNGPLNSWDKVVSKFDLGNPWLRKCMWSSSRSHCWLSNQPTYFFFISHKSALPFLRYSYWKKAFYYPKSWSWPRPNLMVTFEAKRSVDMCAFCFVVIWPFWPWYSKFHNSTLKIQVQGNGEHQTRWSRTSVRVSKINSAARAQITFKMLTLLQK